MKENRTQSKRIQWFQFYLAFSGEVLAAVVFTFSVTGSSPAAQSLTKPVSKELKTSSRPEKKGEVFSGTLLDIDLKDHPMTLTVENGGRVRRHFVFGGALLPRTLVWKNGKSVGVKALKKGDRVKLVYLRGESGPQVTHVRILP